jgi:hypothetical protein
MKITRNLKEETKNSKLISLVNHSYKLELSFFVTLNQKGTAESGKRHGL